MSPQNYYYGGAIASGSTSVAFLTNSYTSVTVGGQWYSGYFSPYYGNDSVQAVQVLALNTSGGVESSMLGVSNDPYNLGQVPTNAVGIVSIAAGDRCNYALRNDGTVIAWGLNDLGELSIPSGLTNVVAIAAGSYHCLALTANGNVVAWGANGDAQTLVPSQATNIISIYAKAFASMALRRDGTLIAWGYFNAPSQVVTTNVSGVAMGICDEYGFTALLTNGSIQRWVNPYSTNILNNVMTMCGDALGSQAVGIRSSGAIQSPTIFQNPLTSSVNYNSNLLLKVRAIGSLPMSYQWQKNGTNLSAATNDWLYMAGFKEGNPGNYQVVVSNGGGSVTSAPAVLSLFIPQAPSIKSGTTNILVLPGNSFSLAVSAQGQLPLYYQWSKGGFPISVATNAVFSIQRAFYGDGGTYSVTVTNSYGSTTAVQGIVTVQNVNMNMGIRAFGGSPMLNFSLYPGVNYSLMYSTDLASGTWFKLYDLPVQAGSNPVQFIFIDSVNQNTRQKYYRLSIP